MNATRRMAGDFDRFRNRFWPDVSSPTGIDSAVTTGRWAAIFVAFFSALVVMLYFIGRLPDAYIQLAVANVVLYAIVALTAGRRSRLLALSALSFYLAQQLYSWLMDGNKSWFVPFLLLFMFFQGVRGAFGNARLGAGKHESV